MASKKTKSKTAKPKAKAAKRPAPRRPGKKTARAAKPAAALKPGGPFPVSSGSGSTPADIGRSLIDLYNAGKWDEPCKKWWSPDVSSVEGGGMAWHGRAAVEAKNSGWYKENTVIGGSAEGPFVGASGFAVKFRMEFESKATGKRIRMEEVGVYTVENGKITREEFMYGPMQTQQMPAPPLAGRHGG